MENQHVRALLRFWWVVAAGAIAAVFVAIEMVASIGFFPPSATPRARPTYTAGELLMLNSASNPYLRTAVTAIIPRTKTTAKGTTTAPHVTYIQPNADILVRAANVYPRLVESDEVAALRTKLFGPMHGTVQAEAYKSYQSPTRYRPSRFPMIQILASTHDPQKSIRLAHATTVAFDRWLTERQAASDIPAAQRIVVQELQSARTTATTGGTKLGLPLLAAAVVLALAGGLALVLDRLFVRVPAADAEPRPENEGDGTREEPGDAAAPPRAEQILSA